jgi:hypothetical protein
MPSADVELANPLRAPRAPIPVVPFAAAAALIAVPFAANAFRAAIAASPGAFARARVAPRAANATDADIKPRPSAIDAATDVACVAADDLNADDDVIDDACRATARATARNMLTARVALWSCASLHGAHRSRLCQSAHGRAMWRHRGDVDRG